MSLLDVIVLLHFIDDDVRRSHEEEYDGAKAVKNCDHYDRPRRCVQVAAGACLFPQRPRELQSGPECSAA